MTSEPQSPAAERPLPGTRSEPAGALAFLCGADMNPLAITGRPGLAGARFVAIGWIKGSLASRVGLPGALGTGEIWGIVLSIPPRPGQPLTAAAPDTVPVVLRDGSAIEAISITGPESAGTIAAILAEAYYWELPVAYRDRLGALLSR